MTLLPLNNSDSYLCLPIKQKVDTSTERVATSEQKIGTSKKVTTFKESADNHAKLDSGVVSSDGKVDTSDERVDTSTGKVDTSKRMVIRLAKVDLEIEIMRTCKDGYIKMEDVARIIGKSVDYLKNKIFPVMMKEGKLNKRFPYTHNHPEQGYKTSEEHAKEL